MPRKRKSPEAESSADTSSHKRKRVDGKERSLPSGTLSDMRMFFDYAKSLNPDKPLDAFKELKNAKLCGYFEKLEGSLEGKTESEVRMNKRFTTDLPEMSTCCVYDGGRYAIWRDEPTSENILIVHTDGSEHFPSIQVVGNRMEHLLCHLAGKNTGPLSHLLPKKSDIAKIQEDANQVIRGRNKTKLGKLPTGVGIWVPVKDDLGYRSLGEKPEDFKKWLTTVGTSKDEKAKQKAMEKIMEIVAYVQFANDECDFGMGLELGHWLMLANYKELDSLAKKILKMAYRLLDRDEYVEIVEEHFDQLRAL